MAKYLKKKKSQIRPWHLIALVVVLVLGGCAIWLAKLYQESKIPVLSPTAPTTQTGEEATKSVLQTDPEFQPIVLDNGLQITRIGSYTGMYVEDGSDEIVTGVMMIILENTTQQDLQLARIRLTFENVTAEFEATNLPAGHRAVLLERNRAGAVGALPLSVDARNVVFFPESMPLQEDVLQITGGDNYLDVTNISGSDLTDGIYIYYKNYIDELYYGGITYRAKIEGGIKAGTTMRVVTGHYTPDSCKIVMVTRGE